MLTPAQYRYVFENAYMPEHLPDYVQSISGAEAHLGDAYLCFIRKKHLIFNAYPLKTKAASQVERAYASACERFKPDTVAIIAPEMWLPKGSYEIKETDTYFRLNLPLLKLNPANANMLRRAAKELSIEEGHFGAAHKRIINDFIKSRELSPGHQTIFKQIPVYLKAGSTATLLEARDQGGKLCAFTIFSLGASDYAFYLFSFRALKRDIPGASDLLFYKMVNAAQRNRKAAINLGLGINAGIRRFKTKWGGVPFVPYVSALVYRKPPDLGRLAAKL